MTSDDLSAAALGRISPALSLSTLAEMIGSTRQHLSRLASGKVPISPGMAARLQLALDRAQKMAADGTLPPRKRMGRPR